MVCARVFSTSLLPRTSWTQIFPSAPYSQTPSLYQWQGFTTIQTNRQNHSHYITATFPIVSCLAGEESFRGLFKTPQSVLGPLITAATTICRSLRYTNPGTFHVGNNSG